MSNQRVVVLTDDEIESLLSQYKDGRLFDAENKLRAAEGITDDLVERGARALYNESLKHTTYFRGWDEVGYVYRAEARNVLEAALFPGDDEQ